MTVAVAAWVGGRVRQCRFPVLNAHCTGQSTTQKSTSSRVVTRAMRLQSPKRAQQRARRLRRGAGPGVGVGGAGSGGLLRPTSTHTKLRPGAGGGARQHSLVPSSHTGSSRRRCAGILACSCRLVRSAGAPAAGTAVGCRQNGQGTASPPSRSVGWAAASRARHSKQNT